MNNTNESRERAHGEPRRLARLLLCSALLALMALPALAQIPVTVTVTGVDAPNEPSVVGQAYYVRFEVVRAAANPSGYNLYGTITVDDGKGNTCSRTASTGTYPDGWTWGCTLTSYDVGTLTLTATFVPQNPAQFGSGSGTRLHEVLPATGVTVFVSDTPLVVNETATGTVVVQGIPENYSTPPTGTVTLSHTGNGTLTPASHAFTAAEGGRFEFTYTPTDAATTPHVITASYAGDGTYGSGSDTFSQAVEKRAADIRILCDPATAFIGQPVTCQIHVEDDTTAGTAGSFSGVELTLSDGTKAGTFSDDTPTLDASGNCTVTYTPGAWDAGTGTATTTISASIASSNVYESTAGTSSLTVKLRPTQTTVTGSSDTLLVNEGCSYTVLVEDVAGAGTASSPAGALVYTSYLAGDATRAPSSGTAPSGSFTYTCTGLDGDAGIDTVYAHYTANDGIHENSGGAFGQGVQRRPTTTLVTGYSTPTGVSCTATVTEAAGLAGTATDLRGNIETFQSLDSPPYYEMAPVCSGLGPDSILTCADFAVASDSPMANVSVKYEPTDRVHLASTGGVTVNRFDQYTEDPGDGTTGAACDEGCGSGGLDIENMILALNATEEALKAVKWGLDIAALIIDVLPDGVITGGLIVQTGVTIPYSDIAKAIIEGVGIALDIAIEIMEIDLDDDGIPDVIEENTTHTDPFDIDSDGDGMSDLDEIDEAGGYYGGSRRPSPNDSDSDDDGISDGDEVSLTHTNFCVADTDCDTASDGVESDTWALVEIRDHADPLMQDTDGDGLRDDLEIAAGCPYVNDDDSDDDGLQDGYEDTSRDGVFDLGGIGDTGSTGSGETDPCDPDTDGDGLLDGQEEGLLGQGSVTALTPAGSVSTRCALDTDSDDDGLSDGEEVNITHTDPLNWDSDGDTLSDLNEHIAIGGIWPQRAFRQVSDPLDPDTDDDGLPDATEYSGTGLGVSHGLGGTDDLSCPYVNDADSDNDGLEDGAEDANHDGVWSGITIGGIGTQAARSGAFWECDACNPDTDGDGLLDGEEAALLGGGPISQRPGTGWPGAETPPGFETVTPEGVSTIGPVGPDYSEGAHPLYTFAPAPGPALPATVPALDSDTDDDGLSDYEEVNTTGTDPLDGDSDNDTLADADELIATGGAWPARTFDQESDPLDINTDDDYLFDPVEGSCGSATNPGTGLRALAGGLGGSRDNDCPYVNRADSDDDGVQDGAVIPIQRQGPGMSYSYTFFEALRDVDAADIQPPGTLRIVVTPATGEQDDDLLCNACDPDSDGDGLADGHEIGLGTDPQDWDTDDDGRSDWHEQTGGGPIPTDPFDPDTDDDGLLDSAEVFGSNTTNPVNADTDGDGLCDGGAGTPYMTSGHPTVVVNPICKSCSTPGKAPCAGPRSGSPDGIGDHPNPMGHGEDENGNGAWDGSETDPNQYDTDGDALADGVERLSFSTSRQAMIPTQDLFGRSIDILYPEANNVLEVCGCLDPLDADSDDDGLSDGIEDLNHDGNWDFATSDFDFDVMPLLGPPHPDPEETNPCDPDTDHDDLTDYEERYQPNWSTVFPFNPTNPLDHDTDNDWLMDGYEVAFTCTVTTFTTLDNDIDGRLDEDPLDGIDNDGDGLLDEDPVDFSIRSVPTLNPTDRDSDSDGYIDGLDEDPCNSDLIPFLFPVLGEPLDSDGDGFSDTDELFAGTGEFAPADHPVAYGQADLDFDGCIDDRVWFEPFLVCCYPADLARTVVIDLDDNVLVDLRLTVVARNVTRGDFDDDGAKDDVRYAIEYLLGNYRALQAKVLATIDDWNGDLIIDRVVVERK